MPKFREKYLPVTFGLNYAKTTREGYIMLCEGYMDVIAMHQAGFGMAVASLGTAFTLKQAQLLKKYTDTVVIAYDSDDAGINATLRCIRTLKEAGVKCKVLDLHPYKDPDEFIKNTGVGALQTRIREAQNPFFFEIEIKEKVFEMSDPASKTEFHRFIAKKLCEFTEPLERGNYLEAAAKKYSIDEMGLRELVMHINDGTTENKSE
ncbi:toprim domain-containing protein [Butyrivibrio sp. FCS014]|uniref:toprim domain-containing protein n=1 Tax=Butyrivibrio sp. FCS014 TaxID=1408304 RepID=UPI000465010B|nr:toprim domain-containing protein [Butyrivibrio sp. FCS014]